MPVPSAGLRDRHRRRSNSMQVTGPLASRPMLSMFAPLAAIRPAMAAITGGVSGLPSTVTCSRPRSLGACSPDPMVISASICKSAASEVTCQWMAVRSGACPQASSTPRISRPRMTTCSTSSTVISCADSTPNSRDVTPGRSRPVKVISTVTCDCVSGDWASATGLAAIELRVMRSWRCPRYPARHTSSMTSGDYDPFVTGPHPVGSRTWQARDEARDRLFTCEIWYPAEPDRPGDASPEGRPPETLREADDNGELRDAAPLPGAHPLVVFSHFSGGGRRVSSFLCRHLASHGYAVAALDHSEVAAPNWLPGSPARRLSSGPPGSMRSWPAEFPTCSSCSPT